MKTKLNSIVLAMAIAAVLLVAAVGSASAEHACVGANYAFFCGDTVNESCILNGSMTCTDTTKAGLNVGKSGITIDGGPQHFTITGNKSAGGCYANEANPAQHSGVRIRDGDYVNVVIKNLEIRNFCTGIGLGCGVLAPGVDNATVYNCTIHDNGDPSQENHGIHMVSTNGCNISDNEIYNNTGNGVEAGCSGGGCGIFLYGSCEERGNYNNFTRNNLNDNRKTGLFMKSYPFHNNIIDNNATGNIQEGGIILMCMQCNWNILEHNNASDNGQIGIFMGGRGNTINNNTANYNGNYGPAKIGISLGRAEADNNGLYGNNASHNGEYGIIINEGATGNILYNNTACFNTIRDISDGDATTGANNTCDTASNYCDTNALNCAILPCAKQCPCSGPNLVISELNVSYVDASYTNYTVNFTVANTGVSDANASNASVRVVNKNGVEVNYSVYSIPELQSGNENNSGEITFDDVIEADLPYTITVCADIDGNVTEPNREYDNCTTDVFGLPDLKIIHFWYEWVDESWKRYNLTYRVKNVGDKPTTGDCWVNFTECYGDWSDCVDPERIPQGLGAGDSWPSTGDRTIGHFVMNGSDDKVQVFADFNKTIRENSEVCNESEFPVDNCNWHMPRYTGPTCDNCGDVDGEDGTIPTAKDAQAIALGNIATCIWAADVDGEDGSIPTMSDAQAIRLGNLNCSAPGCAIW